MVKKSWILVALSLTLIAGGIWVTLRQYFPPGEVNYLNYVLLRPGSSIEEVERVIGPFNDPRGEDAFTGEAIIRPSNEKGVVNCIWFDKKGPIGGDNRIYITFIDGRAMKFRYVGPY